MPKRPTRLARRYLKFLADEGYRPRREDDPDDDSFKVLSFKSEAQTFILFVYEDDPDYFNIGFAFDLGDDPHDPAALANMARDVTESVKGVKCILGLEDNLVRLQVETFLAGATPTAALLERSLAALRHAAALVFKLGVPPERLDA